jgi:hypothetical protein
VAVARPLDHPERPLCSMEHLPDLTDIHVRLAFLLSFT